MSINILMDRRALWHPGDTINGTVVYESREQMDIASIDLEFEGRIKSSETRSRGQNGTVTYKAKISLFHDGINLFKGPYTLPPTRKEWPFQFQFPTNCRHARRLGNNPHLGLGYAPSDGGRAFSVDLTQSLPPSLSAYSDSMFSSRKECIISYMIHAKCTLKGIFKSNITAQVPLRLEPFRAERDRVPQIELHPWTMPFQINSYYLNPQMEDRALTLKEKMMMAFNSKEVPRVIFLLRVKLPKTFISGQDPPIFVSIVQTNTEGSEKKQMPDVQLKSYSIVLQATTHMLVEGGEGVFSNKDHCDMFGQKIVLRSWVGSASIRGDLDIRELKGNHFRRPDLPSFKTFIMSRSYTLKLEGEIECAHIKETFSANCGVSPVVVLPSTCRSMGPPDTEAPSIDDPTYLGNSGPPEDLPSYNAVMKS